MSRTKIVHLATIGSILAGLLASQAIAAAPAAAVPGLTLIAAASPVDSASSKEVMATCPSGTRVLGGGGFVSGGGRQVHLTRLEPVGGTNQFAARAEENGAYAPAWQLFAYGICGRAPAGLEYLSAHSPRNSSVSKQVHVHCSPGKRTISVGARVVGGSGDVVLTRFQPGQDLTEAEAYEDEGGFGGSWSLSGYAVCADPLPGWELVSATANWDSNDKVNSVTCPAGKRLHGFGSAMISQSEADMGQALHVAAYPLDAGLTTAANVVREDPTGIAGPWSTSMLAICAF